MKILIIAYYFCSTSDSSRTIAALRPWSWAKYWSKKGHEIYVLTKQKSFLNQAFLLDNLSIRTLSFSFESHTDLKPFVNTARKNLWNNLYSLLSKSSVTLRKFLGSGSLFYISDFWIEPALKKAQTLDESISFDLIVSSYGPPATHIVGSLLKKHSKAFWVADYRDLWHGNHFVQARWPFSVMEKLIEDYFVSDANLVTTVSEPLRQKLASRFRAKTLTVTNGFDTDDLPKTEPYFPQDGKIRLVYTGTIYAGKQDPLPLLKAISELKELDIFLESKLEVLFYGSNLANLKELIKYYNLQNIVKTPGLISRNESLEAQRSANALIFLDWDDRETDGIFTGKLFEYLYSNSLVLGIGADFSTTASKLIEEAGVGFSVGKSVTQIRNILEKLLKRIPIAYYPVPRIIEQYNREYLAYKMLDTIIEEIHAQK